MFAKFFSVIALAITIAVAGPLVATQQPTSAPVVQVQKQPADKALLNNIRAASVSVEIDERFCGSGTLIEKDGEMYCITAAHVVFEKANSIRVTQHGKKTVTIYASVHKIDRKQDWAVLKVGKGVFESKITFLKDKQELDTPVIHCGSMIGFHHTVTRGTLAGVDRVFSRWEVIDQLDITANRGSSGGGVFDEQGNYLGMVVGGHEGRIVFMVPSRLIDF